jgi:hypothetical protein
VPANSLILLAGVAERPRANEINRCDTFGANNDPANIAGNPPKCRTFATLAAAQIFLTGVPEHYEHKARERCGRFSRSVQTLNSPNISPARNSAPNENDRQLALAAVELGRCFPSTKTMPETVLSFKQFFGQLPRNDGADHGWLLLRRSDK